MSNTPRDSHGSRQNSIKLNHKLSGPTVEVSNIMATLSPTTSITQPSGPSSPVATPITNNDTPVDDKDLRHNVFSKVTGLLHKSLSSRDSDSEIPRKEVIHHSLSSTLKPASSPFNSRSHLQSAPLSRTNSPVKETNRVFLEYDPINKRKVLNTYEILREIGRGEHGKVKLARDLVNKDLVAIKIVNRKSRKERPSLKMRKASKPHIENEYELKIKREIAIMKKCNHKHIVQLREVLDDANTHKIYMVLEYLEKGEIKWKKTTKEPTVSNDDEIPCKGAVNEDNDVDLLSNVYAPNLTFKQSRKIFRDVLLGLEYLHLQGIVHRDIKPANLLVSSDNTVKISDFGVSFASSLNEADEGLINELELAKTAGTPAFFAPELCETNFSTSLPSSRKNSRSESNTSLEILKNELTLVKILPKIDYKIDIWALGVTLYCLLFGKLPFNADSEFDLFQVIVSQTLEFPTDRASFNSPVEVSEQEFDLAKDLLSKLLDKNSTSRIEIKDIKEHPFVLLDLEDDLDALNDLLYLNNPDENEHFLTTIDNPENMVSKDEIEHAVIGIGARIKRGIIQAMKAGVSNHDIRKRFSTSMENSSSINSSSDESSAPKLFRSSFDHSVILSEAMQHSSSGISRSASQPENHQVYSHSTLATTITPVPTSQSRNSSYTLAGIKDGRFQNPVLNEVKESSSSSRRGSLVGGANEVETKRNVVGDLYLKNQSAVDAFKGIQQMDDKRRRSSAFSTANSNSSNPPTTKNSVSSQPSYDTPLSQPVNIPTGGNNGYFSGYLNSEKTAHSSIRIGPISERRSSSVISLPLTESFASLDSANDEYLTLKYKEFTSKKHHHKKSDHQEKSNDVDEINKKLEDFNLSNLMNQQGISFNFAKRSNVVDDGIAPKTVLDKRSGSSSSFCSSSSSSSGSDSDSNDGLVINKKATFSTTAVSDNDSTSGSESDNSDSEEDGNLTLAFSSRVTPSRPKFLSLDQRSKSHDSSLPGLAKPRRYRPMPVILPDDHEELEDIPAGLMLDVPRPSVSLEPMGQESFTIKESSSTDSQSSVQTIKPFKSVKFDIDSERKPSPLAFNAPSSTNATTNSHLVGQSLVLNDQPRTRSQTFNNHYNKEAMNPPFPRAIHHDADKETKGKSIEREEIGAHVSRPNNFRSNSITIGLLQYDTEI